MMNVSSQNNRPYFSYKYEQLFEIAEDNWNDISTLQILKEELDHRNRPWTKDLRTQVEEQLNTLESIFRVQISKDKNNFEESESFPWVSTKVGFGFEKLDTSGWKKDDLLSKLGYKTGNYSDFDDKTRRKILYKAYEEDIPKKIAIFFEDIRSWGDPKSPARLRRIAESIALVVRNEKMHSYDYSVSISERESDLADLKRTYYDGVYDG
jgi:hypothetical protein